MQTDIDRHVDAEAGGAPMNAALTSMYGSASQRGAVIAEGQPVTPPATDAAPAADPPADRVAAGLLPELPPAFAPVHLVAAAAARALAAERGQRPQTKPRASQQSRSAAMGPAVSDTAVGLQATDLSPQPNGDAAELDPQTAATRQAGTASTSGAEARPAGTPAASNKLVNNKKLRRRKSTEPGCAMRDHRPEELIDAICCRSHNALKGWLLLRKRLYARCMSSGWRCCSCRPSAAKRQRIASDGGAVRTSSVAGDQSQDSTMRAVMMSSPAPVDADLLG